MLGNFESVRLRTLRLCRENLTKQVASGAIGFCCFLARGAKLPESATMPRKMNALSYKRVSGLTKWTD
ncbi:hypothetical protein NEIPOLOT_01736 [Neisseria polysaccharea ATCC 43768]|uniref:Uncharacterized protein n=1 Tax=Neisseria polysaccharea TaxID=489 RepID=Q8GG97_NEIPO|nr:hypothetical protein [Neisseria polysaccharea]EFH22440.1 hypothetical protein NEIPOLOT_01736 [Neisseria polysaccharea ATCC 43768]